MIMNYETKVEVVIWWNGDSTNATEMTATYNDILEYVKYKLDTPKDIFNYLVYAEVIDKASEKILFECIADKARGFMNLPTYKDIF